jgi:hypothetical protein
MRRDNIGRARRRHLIRDEYIQTFSRKLEEAKLSNVK